MGQSIGLSHVYSTSRLLLYALMAIATAVVIAGFWNYHLVDGFGRDVVAGNTIGDTSKLSGRFSELGAGFGFIFAAVAGLAATFTACNCVVFAMIPGLVCSSEQATGKSSPWSALIAFIAGVTITCAAYGAYVGFLGADGIATITGDAVRLDRAQTVFTLLGLTMFIWGLIELGFLNRITTQLPKSFREFFASTGAKAGIIGILVGLFSVGRPFPVFREFMNYAAETGSPLYGAGVMVVQGLGQILVMVLLFCLLVWFAGRRLLQWANKYPYKPQLISGLALLTGGTFFIFYWGLAFAFDIGRWGFKLGWY